MKSRKASGRYAQSLIQLAIEKSQLEEVRADMELVAKTCSASDDLTQMLQSSIIKTEVKQRALEAVFSKKVSDLSMHFMNMLAEKKREAILEAAADSFISIYNEKEGNQEATVTSATTLSTDQKKQLQSSLSSFGKTISLKEIVDPSILGGLQIRIGDLRLDASIRRKLNSLKQEIHKS
jgi:F-type H+-transporting ATPase subunit delta